jgi:hypothetical protein
VASDPRSRGRRLTEAPPPPHEVRGHGLLPAPRIQCRPSEPLRYDFPFPERSQNRVRAEMLRADEELQQEERSRELSSMEREAMAIQWVCRIAGVIAQESCDLAESGAAQWELLRVEPRVNESVRHLLIAAEDTKFVGRSRGFLSESKRVLTEVQNSPEMHAYRSRLTELYDKTACGVTPIGADGARSSQQKHSTAPSSHPTPLGRNIDRLRMQIGWSFDELAAAADIEKKLVLGHVNKGTKAHPSTLKKYATAFSKGLGSTITTNQLLAKQD